MKPILRSCSVVLLLAFALTQAHADAVFQSSKGKFKATLPSGGEQIYAERSGKGERSMVYVSGPAAVTSPAAAAAMHAFGSPSAPAVCPVPDKAQAEPVPGERTLASLQAKLVEELKKTPQGPRFFPLKDAQGRVVASATELSLTQEKGAPRTLVFPLHAWMGRSPADLAALKESLEKQAKVKLKDYTCRVPHANETEFRDLVVCSRQGSMLQDDAGIFESDPQKAQRWHSIHLGVVGGRPVSTQSHGELGQFADNGEFYLPRNSDNQTTPLSSGGPVYTYSTEKGWKLFGFIKGTYPAGKLGESDTPAGTAIETLPDVLGRSWKTVPFDELSKLPLLPEKIIRTTIPGNDGGKKP